ncbi:hypothetical protein MJG53_013940 [Ovis ammon polii x Ovis aries]|uniref:Uncharacterized protein n=1 Tax=Ovis ammon polii x Ovis aries TaxID=2918886 RepID=A0ACB9UK04_9CETA|nr:hypothetical protein MJG53_013940 [Ovis ammon polii x Ovis aries]
MNRCADARAVAATVPGAGVGNEGLRPPMVPRQASFFPPPVPNPFVQQTRLGVARRIQSKTPLLAAIGKANYVHFYIYFQRKITHPVLKFLGHAMFFSMGFVVTVKGKIATPLEAPIFVVAPHSTFFDGIACVAAGLPSIVSRNENVQVPLIGRYCDLDVARIYIFMPVQVPSDEERSDPVLFASTIRNVMAEALKIPVTDHTYEDCRLMISAGQLTLPMEAGLVEFTKISRKLKLDWDGIRKHLDEYAAIASSSKGGRIGIEEFAEYLKLPVSDVLRQLFALFDRALLEGANQGLGQALGGLLGGGDQRRGGGNIGGIVGGIVNFISEAAAAQYSPEPPPTQQHFTNVEANESEEVRRFRQQFAQLAGPDMEVGATDLMNILNKVLSKHKDLKSDGFSLDTCRSIVSVMDSDTTGKLGFEEFKYLWNNIKKWQCVYKQYDRDQSGFLGSSQLRGALQAAGFQLNEQLYQMIVRRYTEEDGSMDFNNFISCLVRLDAMFRAFKSLDRDADGLIQNHDGSIDFREYVIGLAVLCNPANTEEIIQVAFKLFDVDEDGFITEEEFSTILQASLGVPDLDVSGLFKEIAQGDSISYEEFKSFALKHPEYAKIFTTYLDLQTCHVFSLPGEVQATPSVVSNKVSPESHEESTSDKKDD